MKFKLSYLLVTLAVVLALGVIVLGAYTRLTDAGLGCPDWPGCYGHVDVPHGAKQISTAEKTFPGAAVEPVKAWTEMVHRYAAGSLGFLIFIIAGIAIWQRRLKRHPLLLPILLVGLVIFQALLGMWTVTLKLLPTVVMGHLLGGMTLLALLWWFRQRLNPINHDLRYEQSVTKFKPWVIGALIVVFGQIILGGWTSANYAGLACVGFPGCNGMMLPHLNFSHAFNILSPIGLNYQGGLLGINARVTIQMMHRVGAIITALYVGGLSLRLLFSSYTSLKPTAALCFGFLILQFALGVINVTQLLPLSVAVAHNAVAALLLLSVVNLLAKVTPRKKISLAGFAA